MIHTGIAASLVAQIRLILVLARRLTRSRDLAKSASIVAVAGIFVMAMFISLRTLSLSGEQVADRDLGRFQGSVGYGSIVLPPGEARFGPDVRARAIRAGVDEAEILLSAANVQVATTPARDVTMLEAAWQASLYPERYRLLSGRWPTSPGEVVVTEPKDVPAITGGTLPVLGGKVALRVVGTADDRFAHATNLLVAPGTWATLDPDLAEGFPLLGAQPVVLWSGGEAADVVAAFSDSVREAKGWLPNATDADPRRVEDTLLIREQLEVRPERTGIERSPAGYTLPSMLLPVAAVLLVFGLNERRLRATSSRMTAVGVRPSTAVVALTAATLAWCVTAAAAGAAAGTAVGVGARAVIAQVRDLPSGPVEDLVTPLLRLFALVILSGIGAGSAMAWRRGRTSAPPVQRSRRQLTPAWAQKLVGRDTRHILIVATWCTAAAFAVRVETPARAMILLGIVTLSVLLMIPDVTDAMLRVLPETGPRRRLARRQLQADRRRAGAAVAILTVLLGTSMGFLVLLDTMIRTLHAQAYSDVLPGQVLLADRASTTFPPPAAAVRAIDASGVADGLPRTELNYLFTLDEKGVITRSANRPGQEASLLAVESPAHIEHLVGRALTAAQHAALTAGGLLVWADAPEPPTETTTTRLAVRTDRTLTETTALPVATVDVPLVEWRVGTDGIMLLSTAEILRLPIPPAGPVLISGASEAEAIAIQNAVSRAGLDARTARVYTPPAPPVPQAALVATAAGLAILVLAGILTATRAQTRTLRGYLARLIAIGVPPAWTRHVLLYQYGVIIAVSTLLSMVIALPPTVILAIRDYGFAFSIPWGQLGVLLTAVYVAAVLAALRSTLSLRAVES